MMSVTRHRLPVGQRPTLLPIDRVLVLVKFESRHQQVPMRWWAVGGCRDHQSHGQRCSCQCAESQHPGDLLDLLSLHWSWRRPPQIDQRLSKRSHQDASEGTVGVPRSPVVPTPPSTQRIVRRTRSDCRLSCRPRNEEQIVGAADLLTRRATDPLRIGTSERPSVSARPLQIGRHGAVGMAMGGTEPCDE